MSSSSEPVVMVPDDNGGEHVRSKLLISGDRRQRGAGKNGPGFHSSLPGCDGQSWLSTWLNVGSTKTHAAGHTSERLLEWSI